MNNETRTRLVIWGHGDAASASLACAILAIDGATDIDPVHPQGGRDGGKDILCKLNDVPCVVAVHFCNDSNTITAAALKKKFTDDVKSAASHGRSGFIFITNIHVTDSERTALDEAATAAGFRICALYHLERIHPMLDKPLGYGAREKHLGIPVSDAERISYDEAKTLESRAHTERVAQELREQLRSDMKDALSELLKHAAATGDKVKQ